MTPMLLCMRRKALWRNHWPKDHFPRVLWKHLRKWNSLIVGGGLLIVDDSGGGFWGVSAGIKLGGAWNSSDDSVHGNSSEDKSMNVTYKVC